MNFSRQQPHINFVIFHPYQEKLDYHVSINMFDHNPNKIISIESKEYVKYLWILVDSKISKAVGIIARLRHFVPLSTLQNIYRSLILPYMSYGIVAWGQAAQVHLLILQKRALSLMYFKSNRTHAIPLFISSRFLPLNMLYCKAVSTLMYDVSNNSSPCKITALFTYSKEIHTHNTRFAVLDNFDIKPPVKYKKCVFCKAWCNDME